MLDAIEKLLSLQERDRQILQLQEELRRIPPERAELQQRVQQDQKALAAAKLRTKQLESERKALEDEVTQKRQQIEKYSVQQYQTKKNEEYRALDHEILLCKQAITRLEDSELDVMQRAEDTQKEVLRISREATDAKHIVDSRIADLAARETELQAQLSTLTGGRDALAAAIDPVVLARYERMVKTKGGNVLVGIHHGVCGGCHMQLSRQTVVHCQAEQEIVHCTNCGRILYFTPDMDVALVE